MKSPIFNLITLTILFCATLAVAQVEVLVMNRP
jgi:hypothetical protein